MTSTYAKIAKARCNCAEHGIPCLRKLRKGRRKCSMCINFCEAAWTEAELRAAWGDR